MQLNSARPFNGAVAESYMVGKRLPRRRSTVVNTGSYMPHFAWVPVYNNACRTDADGGPVVKDGFQVGIFKWLRRTRLSQRKGG